MVVLPRRHDRIGKDGKAEVSHVRGMDGDRGMAQYGNFDNNILSILSYAATQATWVSATTLSRACSIAYDTVRWYLVEDVMGQPAEHFRFDYAIRRRLHDGPGHGYTIYVSAVSRGYTT